ncbi:unnamed protein product [Echinostoma caproni]|uniref:G_PROTEIN_RECEP_F1_2 domain-containing protein n=1 Tax=Echinostoma caproni TaxID=27848 RepID=A0A183AJV4_9TREM|nr:unnamed protein product [Echinostoma caproni]
MKSYAKMADIMNITVNTTTSADKSNDIEPHQRVLINIACVLLAFGTTVSFYNTFALIQTRVDSILSKILMYNHNIFNGTFCIVVGYLLASFNYTFQLGNKSGNPFICYALQAGFLVILCGASVICNVICQCADRFWAIIYPKSYRVHTKRYIISCYVFICTYSGVVASLRLLRTDLVNGRCIPIDEYRRKYVLAMTEIALLYILPVVMMVSLTVPIIWHLRQYLLGTLRNNKITPVSQQTISDRLGRSDGSLNALYVAQRGIFLNSMILVIELILLVTILLILLVLDKLRLALFGIASPFRIYYLFVVTLTCTFNPFITTFTVTPLRRTVGNQWRKCNFHIRTIHTKCLCLHPESN